MAISRVIFPGRVPHKNAVSVRGSDGLWQYGWLIHKEEDGLLVDFRCGPDRMQVVPFGRVFRLDGVFSAWYQGCDQYDSGITTVLKENDPVEVLLQFKAYEPWKWHPGRLIAADFKKGCFGHVSVSLPSTVTACIIVPGQQIRLRSHDSQLESSVIKYNDPVNLVVHYPLPVDFRINHLPHPILADIFDCLHTEQQTKMRRVCFVWNNIILVTAGLIINMNERGWPYIAPPYWHSLWKPTTRIIVMDAGEGSIRTLAGFIKRVQEENGYPRLAGVALRRVYICSIDSRSFCLKLCALRDALASFEPTCRFIKLIGPKLGYSQFGPYLPPLEMSVSGKWINISERGFSERFRTSFSIHNNNDLQDQLQAVWMLPQSAASRCITQAVDPGSKRLGNLNKKHLGMPFPSDVYTGSAVAIRGHDGLLHYARVVAKEKHGLLVSFCNRKPFVFVPFGKIYSYNTQGFEDLCLNKPAVVLLRLQPDEPWKWYPANILAVTGPDGEALKGGFVTVSLVNGTTAVVPSKQLRAPFNATELQKHLLSSGDDVRAELHKRLEWEMKINDLPSAALGQVLDCLSVTTCFQVRSVCRLWDQIVGSTSFNTIHLDSDAYSSVACLSQVWNKEVTTVIMDDVGDYFPAVCHLLSRLILHNGCTPLKTLVLQNYNDLPITYAVGRGLSQELLFSQSVCQNMVFRNAQTKLHIKFDADEDYSMVLIKSGHIALSQANFWAQFSAFLTENVQTCVHQMQSIRSYFSQPDRSAECVDCMLEILEYGANVMRGASDGLREQWSPKHLVTLQPEKLNGLAVAAIAGAIQQYER